MKEELMDKEILSRPYSKKSKQIDREEERQDIYKKLLDMYGTVQMIIAIEELSELQKEICKALRGKESKEHITEEIADVEIMLEQVKLYYHINEDAVESQKQAKIERTIERCLR